MGRNALLATTVVVGLGVVVVSVLADVLGLGSTAFGWEQKVGVVVGTTAAWFAALALAGWSPRARRMRAARGEAASPQHAAAASA